MQPPLRSSIVTLMALGHGASLGHAAPLYDVVLVGGRVVDPKNGVDGRRDVAISQGRIAAVAPSIPRSSAHKVIDAQGLLVTPGLIDMHAHFLAPPHSTLGPLLAIDSHTLRSCVTTVVDAGGVGWRDFPTAKQAVMDRLTTRALVFLNIVGRGMGTTLAQQDLADMDAARTAETATQFAGVVVGIKTAHFNGPSWTAVDRALEAGRKANIPVMVDFGAFRPERPFETLVTEKLRPGDIYTHTYRVEVPMLDDKNQLRPYLRDARKRGVLFDVGHGQGSFLFRQPCPPSSRASWPTPYRLICTPEV